LSVAKSVTPLVAAVMVVHWGGAAADVKKIKALTGLDIIEDCAHAFGSYYELPATQDEGTKVGNSGNYCCFSFQAIKHLTTGDGGMLILPSEDTSTKKQNCFVGMALTVKATGKTFDVKNR
jgi:dTDP-4-amino-4,6-dideoxygalactose transaminase